MFKEFYQNLKEGLKKIKEELKNFNQKLKEELKKSFKTKYDYIGFIICQIFVLLAIFVFQSSYMTLFVIIIYCLIEYLIDQKNKAEQTDDII